MNASSRMYITYSPFDAVEISDENVNACLERCKFLKETQEEAKRFYCLYSQCIAHLEVVVVLCAGDFDNVREIDISLAEIINAIGEIYPTGYFKEYTGSKYHDIIEKIASACDPNMISLNHKSKLKRLAYHLPSLKHLPSHSEVSFDMLPDTLKSTDNINGCVSEEDLPFLKQAIIDAHKKEKKDDLLGKPINAICSWLKENQIIDFTTCANINSQLQRVRGPVFSGSQPTMHQRLFLSSLLLRNSTYLYYEDAQELLFPKMNLKEELVSAGRSNRNLLMKYSVEEDTYLFEIESLIKWLIIQKKLAPEYEDHYPRLKAEAVKGNIFDCPELLTLSQLENLLKQYVPSSQDIWFHVQVGLYSAYIRPDYQTPVFWADKDPLKKTSKPSYEKRYMGIERLIHPSRGGILVRLLNGYTFDPGSSHWPIEVDSTTDEAAIGLSRYIKPVFGLSKDNLVFIKDEVMAGIMQLQEQDWVPSSEFVNVIKSHIDKKIDEQNSLLIDSISTATCNISTPEFAEDIAIGKKARSQAQSAAKEGSKKRTHQAEQRYRPYKEKGMLLATQRNGHYSANSLASLVANAVSMQNIKVADRLKKEAVAKKFLNDPDLNPYLKSRKSTVR